MRHDGVIVTVHRLRQPRAREDFLREVLGVRCTAHSLEYHSEQGVVRVAVAPLGSRDKLRQTPANKIDNGIVWNVLGRRTTERVTCRRIVRNSGRVVEKLTHSNR